MKSLLFLFFELDSREEKFIPIIKRPMLPIIIINIFTLCLELARMGNSRPTKYEMLLANNKCFSNKKIKFMNDTRRRATEGKSPATSEWKTNFLVCFSCSFRFVRSLDLNYFINYVLLALLRRFSLFHASAKRPYCIDWHSTWERKSLTFD